MHKEEEEKEEVEFQSRECGREGKKSIDLSPPNQRREREATLH